MKRGIEDDPDPESMFLKKIPSPNTKAPKIIRKKPLSSIDTTAYIVIHAHGCIESEKMLYIPPDISMLHKKNTSAYGFCSLESIGIERDIGETMDNLIKESEIKEESFPTYRDIHAHKIAAFKENKLLTTTGPMTEEFCMENTCKVIAAKEFANRKYSPIKISASGIPLIIYLSFNHKRYNLFNHIDIQKLADDTHRVIEVVDQDRITSADSIFRSIFEKVYTEQKIELADIFSILYAICATRCNIIDFSCAAECTNTEEQYKSGTIHPPIEPLAPGKGYGKRAKTRRRRNNKYKRNTRRRE